MPDVSTTTTTATRPHRLASVDALRGTTVAAMLLVNDPGDWNHVFAPLDHATWNGCTPTDLIFPFFLFVMGVSIALAILPRLERGQAAATLRNAALWRAARIILLGIAINALAAWLMPERSMRWPGVLQRIGVCFACAGMLAIYTPRRVWWMTIVTLLAIYTVLLHVGGSLAKWDNIVDRIDTAVFGIHVWGIHPATGQGHDPEGLASTLSALATTLLGLVAGVRLRARQWRRLLLAGIVLLVLGGLWSWSMPLNKNLWTPSFALWTAGWAMLALVAFFVAVDMHGWPAPGRRFGVNAIAAYGGSEIMQVLLAATGAQAVLYAPLARWLTPLAGASVASLVFAVCFVLLWWAIVWVMDRRRWYLKI